MKCGAEKERDEKKGGGRRGGEKGGVAAIASCDS